MDKVLAGNTESYSVDDFKNMRESDIMKLVNYIAGAKDFVYYLEGGVFWMYDKGDDALMKKAVAWAKKNKIPII